ncbi:transcription factor bHLH99-like, partial [Phalaenopsis equestris]|uniref:transcription factor bHLH99-like n=1 Tax=Phalaenopsis equestris TaxID=78828 RepID=UPI0009E4953C
MNSNSGTARPDRKTVERNRRKEMKLLYASLSSLLPGSKVGVQLPLPRLLDESVGYIKDMQKKLEQLKLEHKSREAVAARSESSTMAPHLQFRIANGRLSATIITDARDWSVFHKVVEVIQDEECDILSAHLTVSAIGSNAFYVLHSLVGEDNSSKMTGILEKLRK